MAKRIRHYSYLRSFAWKKKKYLHFFTSRETKSATQSKQISTVTDVSRIFLSRPFHTQNKSILKAAHIVSLLLRYPRYLTTKLPAAPCRIRNFFSKTNYRKLLWKLSQPVQPFALKIVKRLTSIALHACASENNNCCPFLAPVHSFYLFSSTLSFQPYHTAALESVSTHSAKTVYEFC